MLVDSAFIISNVMIQQYDTKAYDQKLPMQHQPSYSWRSYQWSTNDYPYKVYIVWSITKYATIVPWLDQHCRNFPSIYSAEGKQTIQVLGAKVEGKACDVTIFKCSASQKFVSIHLEFVMSFVWCNVHLRQGLCVYISLRCQWDASGLPDNL